MCASGAAAIAQGNGYVLTEADKDCFALTDDDTKELYLDVAANTIKVKNKADPTPSYEKVQVYCSDYTGVYDGKPHTFSFSTEDGAVVSFYKDSAMQEGDKYDGKPSFTDAVSNTVYYKATKGGKTDATGSAKVTINKYGVDIPVAVNYEYDGTEKIEIEETEYYSVSGDTRAIEVNDSYKATLSLKDTRNTQWKDSTIADKEIDWKITVPAKKNISMRFTMLEAKVEKGSIPTYTNELVLEGVESVDEESVKSLITYTSGKTDVVSFADEKVNEATINNNGYVSITANFPGNSAYAPATAKYYLTVFPESEEGHSIITRYEIVTDATCTEAGIQNRISYCKVCLHEFGQIEEEIPVKGHFLDDNRTRYEIIKDATCTALGIKQKIYYCKVCGNEYERIEEEIPAKGHTFDSNNTCVKCGYHIDEPNRKETVRKKLDATLFTGTEGNPVCNGSWTQDARGVWHFVSTQTFRNTWGYIVNPYAGEGQHSADGFYFDANGNMLTGWQFIQGKWYYLNPTKDGTLGACQLGGVTPDGWTVDESGAWIESIPRK